MSVLLAERGRTHGDFGDSAEISQALKSVFRRAPNWPRLSARQREGLEMLALKLSRYLSGDLDYADHLVDAIGYLQLLLVE